MGQGARGAWVPLREHSAEPGPRYLALYRQLRQAILTGGLRSGARLPSSRTLALDLDLSRTTVEEALRKLEGEGFLVRRVGDGTYVSPELPLPFPGGPVCRAVSQGPQPSLSQRGEWILQCSAATGPMETFPFSAGPAPEAFPHDLWHRLLVRRSRCSGPDLFGSGDPSGYAPLREAIAEYLIGSRGVRCRAEDVVVLTSSQQALELLARILLDPGDQAWVEEPGYRGARAALSMAGARLVPVPVDAQGLDIAQGRVAAPNARLVYTTPSHQYPLGPPLSLERRLALLAWARSSGAWVLEDDYDSEFRYVGRPLAAIQGLEPSAPVVYIGTFSKAMFPALRLAYVVAPPAVAAGLRAGRSFQDGHPPTLPQAALADFIREGHFHAHIRKMRTLYRARRDALLEALTGGGLQAGHADAGLHVPAFLRGQGSDQAIAAAAARKGLALACLSSHYLGEPQRQGFVLGFSALSPAQIQRSVRRLVALV